MVKVCVSMFKASAVVTGLGQALGCQQRVDLGGTPAPWRFLFKHRAFKTKPSCTVFMFPQVIKHATPQHHETGTLDDSPTINSPTFQTARHHVFVSATMCHLSTDANGWFLGIEKVVKGQDERILLGRRKNHGSHGPTMDPWLGSLAGHHRR